MQKPAGLACARCHGLLRADSDGELRCTACAARYPVIDGIPSFVETDASQAPLSGCALSVVIPALNEAANLDLLLPEVERSLQALQVSHELIVVDGGSTDGTEEVVKRQHARLVSQRLPGFGGAYRAGFERARGEYVLTLDADGSHDPSFIDDLWARRNQAEVIIASRYVRDGAAEMPLWRYLLSRLLNTTFRRGLSLPVADLSSGYRLYLRSALAQLDLKATDFDVLEEILIRALAAGCRVHEVAFRYRPRISGRSHARLLRFAVSYVRTFVAMWRLRNSIASADYDARAYDSVIPLQRYWQRRRHRVITRLASGYASVLDVGCGSSRILGSNPGWVGLDVQIDKLRYARRYGNPLVHGSIFALPFEDKTFDCVVCSEVIEHIPPDERPFDEMQRVLKPGGRLILGTPDYDRWMWRAMEWLYRRLAPGGYADEHISHYSRSNLAAYLMGKGFEVESVAYVGGGEMIFSLKKMRPMASMVPAPSVRTALRVERAA